MRSGLKAGLVVLGLLAAVPVAQAQIVIQAPPIPGVTVPAGPGPGYRPDYWRGDHDDWRRRAEFRDEEHRRIEWRRAHCVRDYRGEEFCRR